MKHNVKYTNLGVYLFGPGFSLRIIELLRNAGTPV